MSLPPAVVTLLTDSHDRKLSLKQGPVVARDAASVSITLAELATRAILHGQVALAEALIDCLRALPVQQETVLRAG